MSDMSDVGVMARDELPRLLRRRMSYLIRRACANPNCTPSRASAARRVDES